MVCIELAWPSPSIIDKTPCGATLFTTFSGTGLLEFVSLMGVVGTFARCGVWTFHADFLVRIFWCGFLGADFFRGLWGADFFADFVMSCADFGVRIFSADFLGCFPAEKALRKSHQKIPPKNPHQRSSPRSVFFKIHHHAPSGKTQQISSERLGADAPCREPFSLRRWHLSGRMRV